MERNVSMTTTQVTSNGIDSICLGCFQPGNIVLVERLPYGSILSCTHENGVVHKWTRYNSIESLGRRRTGKPSLTINDCPRCHKRGTVSYYKQVDLVIRHEKLPGKKTWGKQKIARHRRCYISDKEQKDEIMRKIGKRI